MVCCHCLFVLDYPPPCITPSSNTVDATIHQSHYVLSMSITALPCRPLGQSSGRLIFPAHQLAWHDVCVIRCRQDTLLHLSRVQTSASHLFIVLPRCSSPQYTVSSITQSSCALDMYNIKTNEPKCPACYPCCPAAQVHQMKLSIWPVLYSLVPT